MSGVPTFDEYLASLAPFAPGASGVEPEALALCRRTTATVHSLVPLTRAKLAAAVAEDPQMLPVLAAVAGFSQERFKTWLQSRFHTAGWVRLGRDRAGELIEALDDELGLVDLLQAQSDRTWTWADVLARVMAPRQRAGTSVQQGRDLEDAVEEQIEALGQPYETRTRFSGRSGQTAPADFAIPSGPDALIAVAVKGFDSTGSKLSDATREIEEMVKVKTSRQFIFAVVDGQGWFRRQNDLRRIHALWDRHEIDGLYTRAQLVDFGTGLTQAATRLGLT